jgi:hypothetical protein
VLDDATVRTYLPGRREAVLFAGLALLGLFAWALSTPSVAGYLLGERFYRAAYSFPFYFGLPLYALLALLAGFFFPRGFWLWGAALYCLAPSANSALAWWVEARGGGVLDEGPLATVAYALTLVLMAVDLGVAATLVSALGAGLRVLPRAIAALRRRGVGEDA